MIADAELERWLAAAADDVALPDGGLNAAMAGLAAPARPSRVARFATRRWAVAAVAATFVVVAGSVAAVHHGSSPSRSAGVATSEQKSFKSASGPAAQPLSGTAVAPQATSGDTSSGAQPVAGPRVVRTATVEIEVAPGDVDAALARVRGLAGAPGYVSDSSTSLDGGTVTLRVPVAEYDRVRDALAGGSYGSVLSLQEQGQDVTAQYTDLAARITALQASRSTYLALLARAGSIQDTLAVQQQLDQVQQQIEQLQGQQKVLADQSDDATVTVTVSKRAAAGAPGSWHRAFDRAGSSVVHAVQAVVAASGVALVVVVVALLVGWLAVVGSRRLRRRLL